MSDDNIVAYLRQLTEHWYPPMCPVERLMLDCGANFVSKPLPRGMRRMAPRRCYDNAARLVRRRLDLEYVEGFAIHHNLIDIGFPVKHAWCVNAELEVVDPTWENPEQAVYRGVIVSREMLRASLVKHPDWGGVFDFGVGIDFEAIEQIRKEME